MLKVKKDALYDWLTSCGNASFNFRNVTMPKTNKSLISINHTFLCGLLLWKSSVVPQRPYLPWRNLAIIAFMSEGLKSSWTIDASENIGYLCISPYKVNVKMNSTFEKKMHLFYFSEEALKSCASKCWSHQKIFHMSQN